MDVPLRVTIQQRDYGLRVKAGAEQDTLALVRRLDERITAFRRAFPMQPELTAVVMTALALVEEARQARTVAQEAQAQLDDVGGHVATVETQYTEALVALDDALCDALYAPAPPDADAEDTPTPNAVDEQA